MIITASHHLIVGMHRYFAAGGSLSTEPEIRKTGGILEAPIETNLAKLPYAGKKNGLLLIRAASECLHFIL